MHWKWRYDSTDTLLLRRFLSQVRKNPKRNQEEKKEKTKEQLKPFPKELGQKLYEPARCGYFENVSSSESAAVGSEDPKLPSLTECESMFTQTMKVTVHKYNIIQESETSIIPFDFNKAKSCSPTSTSKSPVVHLHQRRIVMRNKIYIIHL